MANFEAEATGIYGIDRKAEILYGHYDEERLSQMMTDPKKKSDPLLTYIWKKRRSEKRKQLQDRQEERERTKGLRGASPFQVEVHGNWANTKDSIAVQKTDDIMLPNHAAVPQSKPDTQSSVKIVPPAEESQQMRAVPSTMQGAVGTLKKEDMRRDEVRIEDVKKEVSKGEMTTVSSSQMPVTKMEELVSPKLNTPQVPKLRLSVATKAPEPVKEKKVGLGHAGARRVSRQAVEHHVTKSSTAENSKPKNQVPASSSSVSSERKHTISQLSRPRAAAPEKKQKIFKPLLPSRTTNQTRSLGMGLKVSGSKTSQKDSSASPASTKSSVASNSSDKKAMAPASGARISKPTGYKSPKAVGTVSTDARRKSQLKPKTSSSKPKWK